MAVDDAADADSASLRTQGNDLYKAGKFEEAIPLYQESAELAPSDPAPLSNLSAAYFELGNYEASVIASDQALALLEDQAKKQKVAARKLKSLVYSLNYQSATESLDAVQAGDEKEKINQAVQNAIKSQASVQDWVQLRIRLVNELPRCKPQIRNVPEYFVVGHDVPESLYDDSLLKTGRDKISLLFAGIGDSRNLHATLFSFFLDNTQGKLPLDKTFHITICDHKPAVIARDILMHGMLSELAACGDDFEKQIDTFTIPLLYYMFLSPIMPDALHTLLQRNITHLIEVLEDPHFRMKTMYVPPMYNPAILKVLREWQHEAGAEYHTVRMRMEAIRQRAKDRASLQMTMMQYGELSTSIHNPPEGCEKEEAFYRRTGVLVMNWAGHNKVYEPELQKAYENFDPMNPDRLDTDFLDTIDSSWKTNPTFIDLDWQRNREDSHADTCIGHDPFRLGHELKSIGVPAPQKQGLLNFFGFWMMLAAKGLTAVKSRIKIECCIGDITTVLEQIRIGAVGHRTPVPVHEEQQTSRNDKGETPLDVTTNNASVAQKPQDNADHQLEDFPKAYDRIHLSNIPDYIGGSFATFLYAMPVLHPGKHCYVTATCLRNPPRFKTHNHFNHEYLAGLCSPSDLVKAFQVRMEDLEEPDAPLVLSDYVKWHRKPVSRNLSSLLSRDQIELWLFRFFLKISIPMTREMRTQTLIYSPLNLTAIIRLCAYLYHAGYPAHWLSGVLEEICSGKIRTRARPPRSEPLTFKETKTDFPILAQSTAPFVAEFTTLLSMSQCTLPFGILSPHIPPIQLAHQYSFAFPEVPDIIAETPAFILVLFSMHLLPREAEKEGIRQFLLSDETGSKTQKGRTAREEGIHIVSTWQWDRQGKKATFWLQNDVFEQLDRSTWGISIWRTDSWIRQAGPELLKGVVDEGPWISTKGQDE
ncbi:hypothetical protein PRZ48_006971 [Zasmidium cellare]|uniref:DUF4470 domain-containing protein n=1 Tax=Zasmidium cellare TaxID=395010 RepID=A0ABR0EJ30_ZASCE|nr:hypothetical protein PRZ48_006971 [Zasmidium cellare]